MAAKIFRSASRDVERVMKQRKKGTLRSGKGGRGGKVTSRKQAIAIGLSEAREKGKKVPKKRSAKADKEACQETCQKAVLAMSIGLTNYWLPGLLTTMGSPTL